MSIRVLFVAPPATIFAGGAKSVAVECKDCCSVYSGVRWCKDCCSSAKIVAVMKETGLAVCKIRDIILRCAETLFCKIMSLQCLFGDEIASSYPPYFE